VSETPEQSLLKLAQSGDQDAYETLQLMLEPDVRRFVRRLLNNNPMLEDDVMQDVFLKFYLNLEKINPEQGVRPYIFRIARNRCYDEFRKYNKYQELSLDDEPVQVRVSYTQAHHEPKPDDITHWLLLQLEVRDAIDQLAPNQRDALILFSEEQLSYAEIAEVMEVSIGTVKSRLYHAKRNLRAHLRPEIVQILDEEFGATQRPKSKKNSEKKEIIETDESEEEELMYELA